MDIKKYCIVCGSENFSRSKKFCCEKCKQKYYYEQNKQQRTEYKKHYYESHKQEYIDRQLDRVKNNRAEHNEYMKNYMRKKRGENENGKNNECSKTI